MGNDMADKRIIRVTGKGNLKVKPDMTRITMKLEGSYMEYDETLRRSAEDTEHLKDILEKHGFDRGDVKTLTFNVEPKNESYQARDKSWKQRFKGYVFHHTLKVEFDSDNKRLGKILYALANAKKINPEFRISYTVKDKEASKNELLGKAVEDARAKAVVLAQAAGVQLKDIQSIDYSWREIAFEYSPMHGDMATGVHRSAFLSEERYDMDIEPNDIEVSDTVTVVWEIV